MDPSAVQRLFESLIIRGTTLDPVAFDRLVQENPSDEAAFNKLREEYERAQQLLGYAIGQRTSAEDDGGVSFFGQQRRLLPELPLGVAPGRELGGFRLTKLIGQGGMGQVWLAEQISIRRRVALKIVRPERVTADTLKWFAREARASARFRHPGIVDVIEHGTSDGIAWIAMEFVEGNWTLSDFLVDVGQQVELPAKYYSEVARFVACLADAMEAVHAEGVIHRDLKPQNILITPDNQPKITDFGLARITGEMELSKTGQYAGTQYYMSPEQVAARRMGIDHRTDIFSLGVLMYEMLAGRRPFEGDTAHQINAQILTKDPPRLRQLRSRIPRDLAVMTGKCLEKDPSRRYQSMGELAAEIRRHLGHLPIHAKPPGPTRKAWLWAQRNPTKSVAGAVGALALAAILGLVFSLSAAQSALVAQKWDLEQVNGRLLETNVSLENQSDRAARAEALAEERRREAEAKAEEILRLSAQDKFDDLMAEADSLWPACPENIKRMEAWVKRAQGIVDQLPMHRERLSRLRESAKPQTRLEQFADREGHPDHSRLAALPAIISAKRRALQRRRGGSDVVLPELRPRLLSLDAVSAMDLAADYVGPDRREWGQEALGLALALRALKLTERGKDHDLHGIAGQVVAAAYVALGRDSEAQSISTQSLLRSSESTEAVTAALWESVMIATKEASSESGLAAAEAELSELEEERLRLADRVKERQTWTFPSSRDGVFARRWHDQVQSLVEETERLQDPSVGLLSTRADAVSADHGWSIPRRLAFAKELQASLDEGSEYSNRWQLASASIRASEQYDGLELVQQSGLVPIGVDPESKLWEFWHVATGSEPQRDPRGQIIRTEDMGVVLVLIPGSKLWMGASAEVGTSHNFDPMAKTNEGPVHKVELMAYFISKYELTQGQWVLFVGRNPSRFQPNTSLVRSLLHPVEQVSWEESVVVLRRMGLTLPSEAQWENACRAGQATPWWTGTTRETLKSRQAANLSDQAAAMAGAPWHTIRDWPDLNDGYAVHGAVGSYAENAFGLHDVHGNVWEWCLDMYDPDFYAESPTRNPVNLDEQASSRVSRGGSFRDTANAARSASRLIVFDPSAKDDFLGIRPARNVED